MNNIEFLSKISSWVQIAAIALVFLSGFLQLSKFALDKRINYLKAQHNVRKEKEQEQKLAILSPRSLTEEQKTTLINGLREGKGRPVALASRLMDGESADFADQIASVFKNAGWDVGPTNRTSLNDFPGFLSMFITGDYLDKDVLLIAKAFKDIGIDCHPENIQGNSISGQLPNRVYVVVGRKRS